jgi:hypothetical protein
MNPVPLSPFASWVYALRIRAAGAGSIPFYDFVAALPSKQAAQLLVFPDAPAMARAKPAIERSGHRLLPVDPPTMRRFGWQPEYATLVRARSGDLLRAVALEEWVEFCCQQLTDEAAAWVRPFERNPQVYCRFTTHEFTAMLAPFGVTYLLTLSEREGVFLEVASAPLGGVADDIGADILELATERLRFTLALLRRKFKEHAAVHARAARAKPAEG